MGFKSDQLYYYDVYITIILLHAQKLEMKIIIIRLYIR